MQQPQATSQPVTGQATSGVSLFWPFPTAANPPVVQQPSPTTATLSAQNPFGTASSQGSAGSPRAFDASPRRSPSPRSSATMAAVVGANQAQAHFPGYPQQHHAPEPAKRRLRLFLRKAGDDVSQALEFRVPHDATWGLVKVKAAPCFTGMPRADQLVIRSVSDSEEKRNVDMVLTDWPIAALVVEAPQGSFPKLSSDAPYLDAHSRISVPPTYEPSDDDSAAATSVAVDHVQSRMLELESRYKRILAQPNLTKAEARIKASKVIPCELGAHIVIESLTITSMNRRLAKMGSKKSFRQLRQTSSDRVGSGSGSGSGGRKDMVDSSEFSQALCFDDDDSEGGFGNPTLSAPADQSPAEMYMFRYGTQRKYKKWFVKLSEPSYWTITYMLMPDDAGPVGCILSLRS